MTSQDKFFGFLNKLEDLSSLSHALTKALLEQSCMEFTGPVSAADVGWHCLPACL